MKAVYVISLDEENNNHTVAQVELDSSSLINEYNAMYDSLWYSWE